MRHVRHLKRIRKKPLTDNVELVAEVTRGRMSKIHSAPVDATVFVGDVGQQQRRHVGRNERGAVIQTGVGPVFGLP